MISLPRCHRPLSHAHAGRQILPVIAAWAVLPGGDPSWHAYRLAVARGFAAWLATTDPAAEVPPACLIPSRKQRATPYLYTDAEIAALIAAAGSLRFPLRAAAYRALIGLLAVTGMRVGEAIGLDRGNADLDAGVLTVRNGKHGESRLVPLHDTTSRALGDYLRLRDRLCPEAPDPGGSHLARRDQAALLQRPRHMEEARGVRRPAAPVGQLPAPHSAQVRPGPGLAHPAQPASADRTGSAGDRR